MRQPMWEAVGMVRDTAPVRRRRRVTLTDVPVPAKIAIVLVLPLLGLLGLAGFAASVYAQDGGRAGDLRGLVAAGAEADHVTDGLQRERLAIARLLTGAGDQARDAFAAEAARTDPAVARFRALAARAGTADPRLTRAAAGLDTLADLRGRAAAREPDGPGQVLLLGYRQLIADLVTFQQGIAERPAPPRVAAAARAAGWLAAGREELALVQVTAVRVIATGELTPADRQRLESHRGAAADAFARFTAAAIPGWRDGYAALDVTADVEALLLGAPVPTEVPADTAGWARVCLAQLDGLRGLTDRVALDSAAIVTDARDRQNRTILLGLAAVLAIAAAAVGIAVAVGRSMTGPLRTLHAAARTAVAPHPAGPAPHPAGPAPPAAGSYPSRPVRHADAVLSIDLPVSGRDEIGRVAETFHAAQRAALRAAADQAALRAGSATMFADLARRSSRLTDALIERLDGAERDETDPDRLALLFAVDHLATRVRHANQSLLVLAGVDAARAHPGPVPLFDVLRAAQSRIEDYQRVEFGRVDDDVAVDPAAVDGVVHLLAELLDNAARCSGPDLPVVVDGRRTGDGAVLQVADRGPGVDLARLAELNDRLAEPPLYDTQTGLAVVARLAARHGVGVTLEPSPGDGLVATVRLPAAVLHQVAPVLPAPVADRQVLPRPLERSPALPGAEPVDIPHPRAGGGRVPVVRGPAGSSGSSGGSGEVGAVTADGPTVEARAFDDGLPRRRTVEVSPPHPDAAPTVEPDEVRALLSSYQHAIGRFGNPPVPVNQEGPANS